MNKENAHKYLPLVQALADGKTIQHKWLDNHWIDIDDHKIIYFHEPSHYYRIKPEPRTFKIYVNKYTNQIHNQNYGDPDWEQINVQEVLK